MSSEDHQALADSFVFLESTERPAERRRSTRRRNKSRHGNSLSQQLPRSSLASHQDDLPEPICTAEVANLLQGVVLFIDKNLALDSRLGTIATNLGASRSESLDSKVTHVIHGPSPYTNSTPNNNKQRIPRLVNQALDRGIRVVSPSWIYECYEKRRRLPEMYYPFDMDSTCRLDYNAAATSRSHDDDNIFELPEEELVSSSDEDNERHARVPEEQHQQQHTISDIEERDDMYATPHEPSIPQAVASNQLQEEEEQHGGPELVSSSEEEARLERRRKRMAEIAKIKAAKKRQRDQADGDEDEEDAPLMYDAAEGGNALLAGTDRLEIWYGEQSFYHDYNPQESTTTSTRRSNRTLSKSAKRSKGI
ncbi:hypothetical protein O0I10_003162 [Lichtheimia ornata]|uniref:BRCT domain-containing protein n=1 Tax=Lichtheimia ornata TaxID=688661 RepID=A0AAD7V8N3_9FUNG|nr:uncharacterized protein O0I10_003162 [Lichtheimia ornata]KAJ8660940.1 hypothetical protein O0I10_003162 [Lichtheimia ornata]